MHNGSQVVNGEWATTIWNGIWNEALTCKQQTKHHTCLVTPQWPLRGYVMCSQAYSAVKMLPFNIVFSYANILTSHWPVQ